LALDTAEARYGEGAIPAGITVVAILLGMGLLDWLNEPLPHEHFATGRAELESAALRQI
jgi:hypothetical protein